MIRIVNHMILKSLLKISFFYRSDQAKTELNQGKKKKKRIIKVPAFIGVIWKYLSRSQSTTNLK
jgi:hypothetical protein